MAWPGMVEYSAAVQNQRASFLTPDLKAASVVTNRLGLPKVCSGAFAIVYELTNGKDRWAIRCFTKEVGDLVQRYAAIAEHLRKAKLPQFVSFDYLEDGILVNGKAYPIMKMQWVEGVPLGRYVEQHLTDPGRLLALAGRFGELSAALEKQKIGHGDLSADNVLLVNDAIALIDYDGLYVPALAGRKARELGNAAFQHPRRDEAIYGPEVDRFSVLLIATALTALAADPGLWTRYSGGNGILFTPADLRSPAGSALFKALRASADRTVRGLADELARWCEAKPGKLGKLPPLGKLAVKASPAAAAGAAVSITVAIPNGTATQPQGGAAPAPAAAKGAWAAWWRRGASKGAAAAPAPAPAPAPALARAPAAAVPANAPAAVPAKAPAAARAAAWPAVDWSGPFVTGLGLGVFAILVAPETRSLSVLLAPLIVAVVAAIDVAYQRTGEPQALRASVGASAFGAGLFGVLLAPETASASMLAPLVVPPLVYAVKRAAAGARPAP